MKNKKISSAEWEVMNAVWKKSPATSSEVVKMLASKNWSDKTIKTMLARLVKKGVLTFKEIGRSYLYEPLVRKEECIRQESEMLVNRVLDGIPFASLVHFVNNSNLKTDEIKELKRLLSDKEKKGK
jgi:BlaI family transcriptional regulator, penicillinase repressor